MIRKIINKIGKEKFTFLLIIFSALVIMGLYQTFSLLTESAGVSYSNNTKTYKFIIGSSEENEVLISENDSKYIDVTIKNDKEIDLSYALYYQLDKENKDVIVGYLKDTKDKPQGNILIKDTKIISLKIINNSNEQIKIKIGVNSGTLSGGTIKNSGTRITEEIDNLDKEKVNEPELSNNLIPVYYNEETGKWYKADESNNNPKYKWYDYSSESKMWANAIIVTENTRNNYLNDKPGIIINEQDIIAFFVWIPRYKYHIWDTTREGQESSGYIYNAYEKGIEIKFESGIRSSGNINCTYNKNLDNTKNDICKIEEVEINNSNNDMWYTHPAFTYGLKELTGIWIGKFKTTGTTNEPTILPESITIRNQNISTSFTTSKKMNNNLNNSTLDAHLLKNIEWGAVSYLTHSKYGLCSEEGCNKIKYNNSTKGITGRSSGQIEGTENENGNYSYEGYRIEDQIKSNEIETNSIASSTENIYGIYDLSSYISEFTMANMETNNKTINIQQSGELWNNTKYLATKYYDTYSYSENDKNILRTRIGDATGEVTINNKTWNSEQDISYPNNNNAWLIRSGSKYGLFGYHTNNGDKDTNIGFRISLS